MMIARVPGYVGFGFVPGKLRRVAAAVAPAAAVLLLAGCVTPATGADSYQDKAAMSVKAAISEVETARLTVRAMLDDRILRRYADETVSASEQALASISEAFGSVQPPQGTDQVRDEVTTVLSDAEDAVAMARIAVRRSDRTRLQQVQVDLTKVADDLGELKERLP